MRTLFLLIALLFPFAAFAQATATIIPAEIVQGEPFLLQASGVALTDVAKITFNGTALKPFLYKGAVSALGATTLDTPAGIYPVKIYFADGSTATASATIVLRPRIEKPFGIPEKLGGNTAAAAKKVVSTLTSDNVKLLNLKTQTRALWSKPFAYPVVNPIVTDTFGYSRSTVGYEITHKGTDFRASIGTPVIAMNRGVVRLAKTFRTYGKTIVIDHGLGVYTFYMHLSKIKVAEGQLVEQEKEIGLSGDTGYAEGAHLHVTVRIGNTSVDPEGFMALFK